MIEILPVMSSQPNTNPGRTLRRSRRKGAPSAVGEVSVDSTKDHHPKLDSGSYGNTDMASLAKLMVHYILPALLSWGAIVSLIFGGCCSNVGLSPTSRVVMRGKRSLIGGIGFCFGSDCEVSPRSLFASTLADDAPPEKNLRAVWILSAESTRSRLNFPRASHHLCPIPRHLPLRVANSRFHVELTMVPENPCCAGGSLDTEYPSFLHRQHAQQFRFRLQHLRPSTHHPPERR